MRIRLQTLCGIAGMAVATYAGAQVTVYEPSDPVVTYPAPIVTYPAPVVTYPAPVVTYPANEIYQARVISARAVSGGPHQRCWMEKQQIGPLELPGAIIGGTIDLFAGRQSTQYVQRCSNVAMEPPIGT